MKAQWTGYYVTATENEEADRICLYGNVKGCKDMMEFWLESGKLYLSIVSIVDSVN